MPTSIGGYQAYRNNPVLDQAYGLQLACQAYGPQLASQAYGNGNNPVADQAYRNGNNPGSDEINGPISTYAG
jgi:hypothetical protein